MNRCGVFIRIFHKRIGASATILLILLLVVEISFIYINCNWRFLYTMDDPYIHLSVATHIINGTYGINAGEYSSPSSSIIWPWLMAAGIWVGAGEWTPLVLGVICSIIAVVVISDIPDTRFRSFRQIGWGWGLILSLPVILICSAVALPLMGLEHPLHIALCCIALRGLIGMADGAPPGLGTIVTLALIPFARFEGIAFTASAFFVIFLSGYRYRAVCGIIGASIGMAIFFCYMKSHGLTPIPSSVLIKSGLVNGDISKHIQIVVNNIISFRYRTYILFL